MRGKPFKEVQVMNMAQYATLSLPSLKKYTSPLDTEPDGKNSYTATRGDALKQNALLPLRSG